MKEAFQAFVRVQSLTKLNLGLAGSGDLVIKRYFESGSESRQALQQTNRPTTRLLELLWAAKNSFHKKIEALDKK